MIMFIAMELAQNTNHNISSENIEQSSKTAHESVWSDDTITILPLRNGVLCPLTVGPLSFGRQSSVLAVEEAMRRHRPIGVVCQRDPTVDAPEPADLYSIGTAAEVLNM